MCHFRCIRRSEANQFFIYPTKFILLAMPLVEPVMDLNVRMNSDACANLPRKTYPSDVCDKEWSLLAPYLTLLPEDAGQREHSLREAFDRLRYIVETGAPWRWTPNDLPRCSAVYQQTQRQAGCRMLQGANRRSTYGAGVQTQGE